MTAGLETAPVLRCRGIDHISFTVPDLDQAVDFFTEVLGAAEQYRRSGPAGPTAGEMAERFNAHPQARYRIAKLDLGGQQIELFEYQAPDLSRTMPRNCDVGGAHLGLLVDDVEAAAGLLRQVPGVTVLGEISEIGHGHPLQGRKWVYFLTPWGLQFELVSPVGKQAGAYRLA